MPHFHHDGFKIAYEIRGRRPHDGSRPIVLVHGLLLPRIHNYPLADALAERGNQVILIDLLGHGESDRPRHARHHTMEIYGRQVVGLLDHLEIEQAAIGGTSLGANVSLEVAVHAADRCRGLFVEMPVLEHATPAAAAIFLPLVIAYSQAAPVFGWIGRVFVLIPNGLGAYPDTLRTLMTQEPVASAAILHGLMTGRIAPHVSDREKVEIPTFIIGHRRDILHPFSDAEALHRELRASELVQARSFFELRFPPNRLSDHLADFLDRIWG